ncbi:MAG: CotH kinase family protein, partial [Saprospiraceae bacterium]
MKKLLLFLVACIPAYLSAQTGKSAERMLYDPNTIGEIRIKIPATNWVDALDSMRLYGENMMSGEVEIDGNRYAGAGVRFRGNNSYQLGLKRNPLQIKINHTDKNAKHQGYTSLKLSSALRDPSLIREMLFYQIARKYTPAPRACYTKLYINNEYVGLFVNVESVDGQFLREHYNSDGNAFFKAGVDYKSPTPESCRQNIFGSLEYEENLACYKGNFELSSTQG